MNIIYKLFIIINFIIFINCENPISNAEKHKFDKISSVQKQNKPNCLLFVGKLKNDTDSTKVSYGCIPIGEDANSAIIYDTLNISENEYPSELIVVIDETKVLNSFESKLENDLGINIYQLNINGQNYWSDFKDNLNKNKKIYGDDLNSLFYIDNQSSYLRLAMFYFDYNSTYYINTGKAVNQNDFQDKIQCDFNSQYCFVYDGKKVYEFELLSALSKEYSFSFVLESAGAGVNGYGNKLLLSGNYNDAGLVYIYDKTTKNSKLLINTTMIYPLAIPYNSRYVGVITQSPIQLYLIDLETEVYETFSNLKISELYNGVNVNNPFKFSLSSIIPKSKKPSTTSSSSSIGDSDHNSTDSSGIHNSSHNNSSDSIYNSSHHNSTNSSGGNQNSTSSSSDSYSSTTSIDKHIDSSISSFLLINTLVIITIQITILLI